MQLIEDLDGTTRLDNIGTQTLEDGSTLPLPPVLLGQIGHDPLKKTVLLYGHLDVQPAKKVSREQTIYLVKSTQFKAIFYFSKQTIALFPNFKQSLQFTTLYCKSSPYNLQQVVIFCIQRHILSFLLYFVPFSRRNSLTSKEY